MPANLSNRKLLQLVIAIVMTTIYFLRISPLATITNNNANNNPPSANSDYDLAKRESLNFFTDIPSTHWLRLKQKVSEMSPNYNTFYLPHPGRAVPSDKRNHQPGYFYQNHYEPEFVCLHERRIGKPGDGGKWICDPHRISEQEECLVYSVGSNNDFSFEEAILKDVGEHCEIHTFDFGPYEEGAKKVGFRTHKGKQLPAVTYHRYGLGTGDDSKFKSLSTVIKELGHENKIIDIFKIDCEGCEWSTAHQWFEAPVTLRQILVETHKSDVIKTPRFFDILYENNYVIFHKEPNIAYGGGSALEFALIKLSKEFHSGYMRAKGEAKDGALQ